MKPDSDVCFLYPVLFHVSAVAYIFIDLLGERDIGDLQFDANPVWCGVYWAKFSNTGLSFIIGKMLLNKTISLD
jgi:hypothetical protein